jgi:ribonuclease HII
MLDNEEIDKINILNASIKAMHLALSALKVKPKHIVVDGNRFKNYENIAHTTVVKGDGKYANIAAASVLAKTYRDDFMQKIHNEFPAYDWKTNKGYPTVKHRKAIAQKGTSPYHRLTFRLLPQQIKTRKIKKNA